MNNVIIYRVGKHVKAEAAEPQNTADAVRTQKGSLSTSQNVLGVSPDASASFLTAEMLWNRKEVDTRK